jgi:hypothetical protein
METDLLVLLVNTLGTKWTTISQNWFQFRNALQLRQKYRHLKESRYDMIDFLEKSSHHESGLSERIEAAKNYARVRC